MTVLLTISETFGGPSLADSLAGGGTGIDLGSVTNNNYAPIINKSANTGHQNIYIRHDATVDPITDVKIYIQDYGLGTGFTYGGADTAANDKSTIVQLGNSSGSSRNNADGLSGGVWVDMDWNSASSDQFDQANRPSEVKIFGDNLTDGISLESAFTIKSTAMSHSNEADASAPQDGVIGKSGDTTLGDHAHLKMRIFLPFTFSSGGVVQCEFVISYSFTA